MPAQAIVQGLAIVAVLAAAIGCGSGAAESPPSPASATSAPASPSAPVAAGYKAAVEMRVADKLHLTPAQARSQLGAAPNASLMGLAKPRGLAQDQLATVVRAAVDDSADAAVNSNSMPAQQAAEEKRYWATESDAGVIAEITLWFQQG